MRCGYVQLGFADGDACGAEVMASAQSRRREELTLKRKGGPPGGATENYRCHKISPSIDIGASCARLAEEETTIHKHQKFREALFGDMLLAQWTSAGSDSEPWISFARARDFMESGDKKNATALFQRILEMRDFE